MMLQPLLVFHVLSISLAYLSLASMLVLSVVFLLRYIGLKSKRQSLLLGRFFSLELLQKINYFLLIGFLILMTFGTVSGIWIVSVFQPSLVLAKFRVLLPVVLWLMAAFAVYDHYRRGIRGKVLSYWSIIIFSVAAVVFVYELYFLNVFEWKKR